MPAFSQIYVLMWKCFLRRVYFPSVAPIGRRPLLQLRPVALKGGIIARHPATPFLGAGWNHLEPAKSLALLKRRILGHVTEWRLRPVSTNEGGHQKKKIEGRSAIRPCHFFSPCGHLIPVSQTDQFFPSQQNQLGRVLQEASCISAKRLRDALGK